MAQYADLDDFALLCFEGEDTLTFLQGQLSQDMRLVKGDTALLASYSNPKGRVFATFLFWQDTQVDSTYYALVRKDIATFLQKRLRMFVLRAKVTISIASAHIRGLWDTKALNLFTNDEISHAINRFKVYARGNNSVLISYPTLPDVYRALYITIVDSTDDAVENDTVVDLSTYQTSSASIWATQDILAAIPWIGEQTKEVFVAQSINLDAIGAINFKKGCYPGQEVIARSHYLGSLKRRSLIGIIEHGNPVDTHTLLGSDIMQGDTPVGQVVNASSADGKIYLLFEVQLNALEQGELALALVPDVSIKVQPVPYPLEKPE